MPMLHRRSQVFFRAQKSFDKARRLLKGAFQLFRKSSDAVSLVTLSRFSRRTLTRFICSAFEFYKKWVHIVYYGVIHTLFVSALWSGKGFTWHISWNMSSLSSLEWIDALVRRDALSHNSYYVWIPRPNMNITYLVPTKVDCEECNQDRKRGGMYIWKENPLSSIMDDTHKTENLIESKETLKDEDENIAESKLERNGRKLIENSWLGHLLTSCWLSYWMRF